MAGGVVARSGFPMGLSRDALIAAFNAHNQAAIAAIPKKRLLLFEAKQGWSAVCLPRRAGAAGRLSPQQQPGGVLGAPSANDDATETPAPREAPSWKSQAQAHPSRR